MVRVYERLQLTAQQSEWLARQWRCWCRRRVALSRKLAGALKTLTAALPTAACVPGALIHLVDEGCRLGCGASPAYPTLVPRDHELAPRTSEAVVQFCCV